MWLIENLFVMDQFVMETQRLVDLAKQMNLEGKEVIEFFRAERALAMKRRIRISQEKKEARIAEAVEEDKEERIAAKAEKERIAAIEDDERIAAKAEKEKIRRRKKEDEARSHEEAARIRRHKEEEEERIRIHEEMCHLRREADNIRRRRMLQEVWKDAEERRREEEDEGECSISVTDIELWRKFFVSKKRWHWRNQKRLDNTRNTGYNALTKGCSGRRKTWRRRLRRLLSYSR